MNIYDKFFIELRKNVLKVKFSLLKVSKKK